MKNKVEMNDVEILGRSDVLLPGAPKVRLARGQRLDTGNGEQPPITI